MKEESRFIEVATKQLLSTKRWEKRDGSIWAQRHVGIDQSSCTKEQGHVGTDRWCGIEWDARRVGSRGMAWQDEK